MYSMINEFIDNLILDDESIDKEKLRKVLYSNLLHKIMVYNESDLNNLKSIIDENKDNLDYLDKLFSFCYIVKNAINAKNKDNFNLPSTEYLNTVYSFIKDIDLDINSYNAKNYNNIICCRIVYHRLIGKREQLNNEISIIDLANMIYDKYFNNYTRNEKILSILKTLDNIDRGVSNLENKVDVLFTSKEFMDMFSCGIDISSLPLIDTIEEFYPALGNGLFVAMKSALVEGEQNDYDGNMINYVIRYLRSSVELKKLGVQKVESISEKIKEIDETVKTNISDNISDLIEYIDNNLNKDIKDKVIEGIKDTSSLYSEIEDKYIRKELNNYLNQCSLMFKELYNQEKYKKVIKTCISNCKDFMFECNSKNFKDIIDYLKDNADFSNDDIVNIANKCSDLFKAGSVEKLIEIKNTLDKFQKDVISYNKCFDSNFSLFENIIKNKPELFLKDNDLKSVLSFIRGDIGVNSDKYSYSNFKIDKDFLSEKFYEDLLKDNAECLLTTSLDKIAYNLFYIDSSCSNIGINFRNFKINENFISMIIKSDFNEPNDYSFTKLGVIYDNDKLKFLFENNPYLFRMSKEDLNNIVIKCINNFNSDYRFIDLFNSELYFYNPNKFDSKNIHVPIYNCFSDKVSDNVFELLTSGVFDSLDIDKCYDDYEKRVKAIDRLKRLINNKLDIDVGYDEFINYYKKTLVAYNKLYAQVPCVSIKNKLKESILSVIDKYQYELSDLYEMIDSKEKLLSVYSKEEKDSKYVMEKLYDVLSKINSDVVIGDVSDFIEHLQNNRVSESLNNTKRILGELSFIRDEVKKTDKKVDCLNCLLNDISLNDNEIVEYEKKDDLNTMSIEDSSLVEDCSIEKYLDGKNVILFAKGLDLSESCSDINIANKVYKFLGDGSYSLLSKKFMDDNVSNTKLVEKYTGYRSKICSRRENRTPVRVYYIPIHTKYFNCYYVINYDYRTREHHDGGCPNESIYNTRINEAKELEKRINALSEEEIKKFIDISNKKYLEIMTPVLEKIQSSEKKAGK